jgi:hypothetical protein
MYVANQKLGRYNVSIANTKGCFTLSDTITIPKGITGIEDIDPFAGMIIYPNPTSGLFTIELKNQLSGELTISILDLGGKEIMNIKTDKTSENFTKQIDLSVLSKGIYIVKTNINNRLDTRKVIVK